MSSAERSSSDAIDGLPLISKLSGLNPLPPSLPSSLTPLPSSRGRGGILPEGGPPEENSTLGDNPDEDFSPTFVLAVSFFFALPSSGAPFSPPGSSFPEEVGEPALPCCWSFEGPGVDGPFRPQGGEGTIFSNPELAPGPAPGLGPPPDAARLFFPALGDTFFGGDGDSDRGEVPATPPTLAR